MAKELCNTKYSSKLLGDAEWSTLRAIAERHDHDLSPAAAAARLRYVGGVQQRTRRAALMPSFVLLFTGAIVVSHGVLATVWPHAAIVSIAWIAALFLVRPVLLWLRNRIAERRGLHGSPRLRLACAGAALVVMGLAIAFGANPLLSAIAAATAVAAYLGGMTAIALAAVAAGILGDVIIARGVQPSIAELFIGAGIFAVGLVCLLQERARA